MEINCVLDVGANQGQYGRFLRQLGYRGKIISFEPAADDYAILKQAADRDPLWSAHEFALGDEEGVLSMNVTSDSLFNSFLQPNDFIVQQGLRVVDVKKVEVRRLDDVLDSLISNIPEPRVYLKIDTQGYELNVLHGATGVLGQMLALQAEVSVKPVYDDVPDYLEAIAAMTGLG
ncbi:MAG: FkbM family methyltransferase, partial [Candidatus Promineifilaceae bacterium]